MRVAIAGYGVEGEQNYKYWSALGADVTIFDASQTPGRPLPDGVMSKLGENVFSDMNGYDIVVRTAGLNPKKIQTDGKIWSATNEFFAKCPAPIIGVTGTKGKGTTCSLITEILQAAGKTVHLVGNIGVPALEVLPRIHKNDIVVFELSSFQLWDIQRSPQTAVILMIEQDHLNVHKDMDDYVAAKSHIGQFQSEDDLMVYHPTNVLSATAAQVSPAKKRRYLTEDGALVSGANIMIEGNIICDISKVGLRGVHNIENICAAVTAAWRYTQNIGAIRTAITSFTGLPHRLEFVRELHGVKYFNDSFSSAPGASVAAIQSFTEPTVLICGGFDKGVDFDGLVTVIASSKTIKTVLLIGQVKLELARLLEAKGFTSFVVANSSNFKELVELAQSNAGKGDVVLLSPGTASFDMFNNFYERGEQFKQIVRSLS